MPEKVGTVSVQSTESVDEESTVTTIPVRCWYFLLSHGTVVPIKKAIKCVFSIKNALFNRILRRIFSFVHGNDLPERNRRTNVRHPSILFDDRFACIA